MVFNFTCHRGEWPTWQGNEASFLNKFFKIPLSLNLYKKTPFEKLITFILMFFSIASAPSTNTTLLSCIHKLNVLILNSSLIILIHLLLDLALMIFYFYNSLFHLSDQLYNQPLKHHLCKNKMVD